MVPAYALTVDIIFDNPNLGEIEFRETISPCLIYLDALKGAFDKKPCDVSFYPPDIRNGKTTGWSARCVLMISVGKDRGEYLTQLYQAIVRLIVLELPDFEVRAEFAKLNFS
ncbi:MAG: hypothetical protein LBJ72_12460 [Dysgonamonadaceae bacterium]|jgi:hypothetical protein|nr:hypothetical protein [Dysgonamonadaceae bacterium]